MKNDDTRALEFIAGTVASLHGIFSVQVLLGNFDRYWLYVASALVGCFSFFCLRRRNLSRSKLRVQR
jgi:hypothetical protein